jgi:pimeloyl-ACP methyl ester carboxylesterase
MQLYAPLGYACYAFDVPGFGDSYDPIAVPNIAYYVHTFAKVFEDMGLFTEGFHLMGRHSGGSLALEMTIIYLTAVRSIALIGPVLMTAEERAQMKELYKEAFNKPVSGGSHLVKTWEYLGDMGCCDDLVVKQQELLNHVRAWNGRMQAFGTI